MPLSARLASLDATDANWVAIGIFEREPVPEGTPSAELIASLIESKDVTGSIGETVPLYGCRSGGASLLVYGLGKRASFGAGAAFLAGVSVTKRLSGKKRSTLAVASPEGGPEVVSALVEGLIVGTAGPGLRKAEPSRHPFDSLTIVGRPAGPVDATAFETAARRGEIVGSAVNFARELVNTPPSEKPPAALAQKAVEIANFLGLNAEVWGRERLRTERFGGLLGVASGSDQEPRFVHIEYRKGGDVPAVALVGKGVTFDSGGLSLKPSAGMEDMKCDMSGAAIVLATLQAVARLEIPVNLDVSFALTENMTGGSAMKLGDVLTMRNGLTVEVLNTDAEGRLILADVLSYAVERKPAKILDLATLTGACLVALGNKVAGLFANDEAFADQILAASRATGERAWRMPMDEDYGELIKSKVAEIKNVGGKYGGAITAAKFLQRFVGETPWAHLDIAGPAWADDDSATRDAGGTGCFVRTLVALLEKQASGPDRG